MVKNLRYLPQFFAFGIADEEINSDVIIELDADGYRLLGMPVPAEDAPTVGFLLGREDGFYTIDFPYAWSVIRTGARLIGMDYHNYKKQLQLCHGLILPGGSFKSPERYYTDAAEDAPKEGYPNLRSEAYAGCFCEALAAEMPILGICAGAQVIAAECGGLLNRDYRLLERTTKPEHKTKNRYAHLVISRGKTPLSEIMETFALICNSRHWETVNELSPLTGLTIYAYAEDMVPEAWGSEKDKILAVQWHPEDFFLAGDVRHGRIYRWLTAEAAKHKTVYPS